MWLYILNLIFVGYTDNFWKSNVCLHFHAKIFLCYGHSKSTKADNGSTDTSKTIQ